MHTYDVAVVGAGPAGSAAAITLAQLGARTVLFDRAQFPRHKLCGDFLNPAAWPVLHKLGAADAVRACVHAHISSFSVTSAAGQLAASALPLRHDSEPALGIQRYYLDNVLIQRAGDLGVMVRQGCPVTTLQRDGGVWRVLYRAGARQEITRARLLIGADGRNSRVARQLRLDGQPARSGSLGFQLRLKLAPHSAMGLEGAVALYQFPDGYAGVVRVDPETINLACAVERARCRGRRSFHALRSAHLDGNAALRGLLDHAEPCSEVRCVWPVYFPARQRFGPGFLLAGDAAQVTEPVTGEGIYFALRSGQLAALSAVTALGGGTASARALAGFEAACRREFGSRARLNRGLRFLMQRPALLDGALLLFGKRKRWLDGMLKRVCGGPALAQPPHTR